MRENRGKQIDPSFNEDPNFMGNSSPSIEFPCKKHPSSSYSSNGGICAFCLRDKLSRLVCPQCGEQRLPNCSCSVFSTPKTGEPEILRRINSTRVSDLNPGGGFRRIRNLFRKKKEKIEIRNLDSNAGMGVTRSRSLCSFRGGFNGGNGGGLSFYDTEETGFIHSAARASSVSGGFVMESAKMSCFSESEARMSNFDYTMRDGFEFYNVEDPKFIDLKLDLHSSSSSDIRNSNECYGGYNGVSEGEVKKCRKSRKGWRWLFKASSNLGKERD